MAKKVRLRIAKKIDDTEDPLAKQRLFYERYIKSDRYAHMLKKQGYINPDKVVSERLKNLYTVTTTEDMANISEYKPDQHSININPLSEVGAKPHELSHAINRAHTIFKQRDLVNQNNPPNGMLNKKDLDAISRRNISTDKHDSDPHEFKADMDTLRYLLRRDKIYDPSTQEFTKDILEKAKKKYIIKDNPLLLRGAESDDEENEQDVIDRNNSPAVERLIKNAKSDDDLIYLMNNIAKNESPTKIRLKVAKNNSKLT